MEDFMSRRLTQVEFKQSLATHLENLKELCRWYDNGYTKGAYLMVTPIRTIMKRGKNGSNTISLLTRLKGEHIKLKSLGGRFDPKVFFFDRFGLVGGPHIRKVLPDFTRGKPTPAYKWWDEPILLKLGEILTRKDMIVIAGDKEVCHTDQDLPDAYARLKLDGLYHEVIGTDGEPSLRLGVTDHAIPKDSTPFLDSHLVAIRCIAGEVLHSPELLALAGI